MSTSSADIDISDVEEQDVKVEDDVIMGGTDNTLPYTSATLEQEEFKQIMHDTVDTSMEVDTPRNRIPGVRPGTASKHRKDPTQLSTNKHTRRARDRVSKLTGNDLLLHKAKNRDASAISTSKRRLVASDVYKAASEPDRRRMAEDDKRLVIYRRILRGQHANNIALELSMTSDGSTIIELGLGDPDIPSGQNDWTDLTEEELENDPKYQAYLALIDQEDFQFNATTRQESEELGVAGFRQQAKDLELRAFLETRKYWQPAIISLLRKTRHFGRHRIPGVPWCDIDSCKHREFSIIDMVPSIDYETGRLINRGDVFFDEMSKSFRAKRIAPHEYFSELERAVWRNLAAWKLASSSGWIEYPGPSDWWTDEYDYQLHGWVPDQDSVKAQLAFSLMTDEFKEIPSAFERFKFAHTELTME